MKKRTIALEVMAAAAVTATLMILLKQANEMHDRYRAEVDDIHGDQLLYEEMLDD